METVRLKESLADGKQISGTKWRAKIIAANAWGSSAYYEGAALERDGARVFHQGLQMYQNHLSESERWDQPEGKVENLVGKLASDANYEADNPEGPGLYADVEFYPSYVDRIKEVGKDIGLSVNAQGITEDGERDGRYGPVLVALLGADSVDVVTRAGAGGKLTSILESDKGLAGTPIESKENKSMDEATKEALDALSAKFDALPGLFATALKDAGIAAPAAVEGTASTAAEGTTTTDTSASTDTSTKAEAVEVDVAEIVEAVRKHELPAVAAKAITADMVAGKSLEDAVKAQVELREAFAQTSGERGAVRLEESKGARGLAYAVSKLNK